MRTNKEQLRFLKSEILRIGRIIEEQNRETELKELAENIRTEKSIIELFIPEVMNLDPLRDEKLCEYYISLFSEFERLKRIERSFQRKSRDSLSDWLNSIYEQSNKTKSVASTVAKNIAEKIAVSGITAGLIWLGKTIIENWPFGYNYSENLNDNNNTEIDND
jgi:hypothetical protein